MIPALLKNAATAYRMRLKRRRRLFKALRRRHDLDLVCDRTCGIAANDVLLFSTMRNEIDRLEHFMSHYRSLGVSHFLIVDNASTDGTGEYLAEQGDVSIWTTDRSYRDSHFGGDWLGWLRIKFGDGKWCLSVDADEILIYPDWDKVNLSELTARLDDNGQNALGALMVDMYPKGRLDQNSYRSGQDPFEDLCWFDAGAYSIQRQLPMGNLWVQGGVRRRVFFSDNPQWAPTMNKIPLVKWNRRYAYINSTHSMLPGHLNFAYDGPGDRRLSGALLHTKFLPTIGIKSTEEKVRRQHFGEPGKFDAYYDRLASGESLWDEKSVKFKNWEQFVELGIISDGM